MKLSKILYAIVNQILPVPQQILKQFYDKYDEFMKSKQNKKIILLDKKFDLTKNEKIIIDFIKAHKSDGFYIHHDDINEFHYMCSNKFIDKDIIQHQLKHMVEYHIKDQNKLQLFQDKQFKTYITDFCNLITQIYKRLNRRFNVSLETIINKMVIDVVDNKTKIDKYKNLFNGNSDFDCYEKCLTLLQIYKYGKYTLQNKLTDNIEKYNLNCQVMQSKQKYEQFFNILKQHVKLEVKKHNQYNVDKLIIDKNFYQLDKLIQKRVVPSNKIEFILDLYITNNKTDYIINIKDSYPTLNKNLKDKINKYLGENNE